MGRVWNGSGLEWLKLFHLPTMLLFALPRLHSATPFRHDPEINFKGNEYIDHKHYAADCDRRSCPSIAKFSSTEQLRIDINKKEYSEGYHILIGSGGHSDVWNRCGRLHLLNSVEELLVEYCYHGAASAGQSFKTRTREICLRTWSSCAVSGGDTAFQWHSSRFQTLKTTSSMAGDFGH